MSWFRRPSARDRRLEMERQAAYWRHQPGRTTVVCPVGCGWQRTIHSDSDAGWELDTHLVDAHNIDLDADRAEPVMVEDGIEIYQRNYGGNR